MYTSPGVNVVLKNSLEVKKRGLITIAKLDQFQRSYVHPKTLHCEQVPSSSHRFTEYLSPNNNFGSFFFDPVTPDDIEQEILSIPKNKAYGL